MSPWVTPRASPVEDRGTASQPVMAAVLRLLVTSRAWPIRWTNRIAGSPQACAIACITVHACWGPGVGVSVSTGWAAAAQRARAAGSAPGAVSRSAIGAALLS